MATTLTARVALSLAAELNKGLDVGSANYPATLGVTNVFDNGTGANQANELFTDTRTLTASSSENLDLAGVLADAFGAVLSFTRVKAIMITAAAANTNDVVVGGHPTAAFSPMFGDPTDTVVIKPGGTFVLVAPDATGYPVVATTADMLTVTNSAGGTSVTYTIAIVGTV